MRHSFALCSLNVSAKKGEKKSPVAALELVVDHGIRGDAHAGNWHRQISLLADEDIETMRGHGIGINYGDFAENITTRGVSLSALGKECHQGCAIREAVGDCVMPRKGIFAKVITPGRITCESPCYYDL